MAASAHCCAGARPGLQGGMQPDTGLIFWNWAASLLGVAADAAVSLPLMAALTLILGRRGHMALCARGAAALGFLGLALAPAGVVTGLGDFLLQLSRAGHAGFWERMAVLAVPAGRGPALSLLCWLVAMACVAGGSVALARAWHAAGAAGTACAAAAGPCRRRPDTRTPLAPGLPGGLVSGLAGLRIPLCLLLAGALCFFAALACRDWPFAGLPPGMDPGRVAAAVLRHATRLWFTTLAAGGAAALALAALALRRRRLPPDACAGRNGAASATRAPLAAANSPERAGIIRWCALWAAIGYLPSVLERWGLALGLWLRPAAAGTGMRPVSAQVLSLVLLSMAIACWVALLIARAPERRLPLVWAGLLFLLLARSAPFILVLAGF